MFTPLGSFLGVLIFWQYMRMKAMISETTKVILLLIKKTDHLDWSLCFSLIFFGGGALFISCRLIVARVDTHKFVLCKEKKEGEEDYMFVVKNILE